MFKLIQAIGFTAAVSTAAGLWSFAAPQDDNLQAASEQKNSEITIAAIKPIATAAEEIVLDTPEITLIDTPEATLPVAPVATAPVAPVATAPVAPVETVPVAAERMSRGTLLRNRFSTAINGPRISRIDAFRSGGIVSTRETQTLS